ncbi:MAG: hypothetical protein DRP09_19530 [Candidatus Thorarchaeota archaeon]|nr:MAG: hypothetical protein DRP09_19530 [Candidatus Thorarchaeota archaeon]
MKKGYKYKREQCPYCGDMIADNWWVRHLRIHHPDEPKEETWATGNTEKPAQVELTPHAQFYLLQIDDLERTPAQVVEESLRIYTYLGSFIDVMIRWGIVQPGQITGQKRPPIITGQK